MKIPGSLVAQLTKLPVMKMKVRATGPAGICDMEEWVLVELHTSDTNEVELALLGECVHVRLVIPHQNLTQLTGNLLDFVDACLHVEKSLIAKSQEIEDRRKGEQEGAGEK